MAIYAWLNGIWCKRNGFLNREPEVDHLLWHAAGTRLTRRQITDIQKTVVLFPALSRHELAATLVQSSRLVHTEGSGSAGVLSADAGAAGVRRHSVAAAEATGIENGNRGPETTAYEPLGSGFRHRVRAAIPASCEKVEWGGGGG